MKVLEKEKNEKIWDSHELSLSVDAICKSWSFMVVSVSEVSIRLGFLSLKSKFNQKS